MSSSGTTNVLLVVAIILVMFYLYKNGKLDTITNQVKSTLMPASAAPTTAEKTATTVAAAEKFMIGENAEYFAQACGDVQLDPPTGPCDCPMGSNYSYATNAYGTPDGDFTTWVKNQSIDPSVAANHKEFISDRTGENPSVNVIGRTYTPEDSHQSYTPPNSWIGIRGRPSLVPVCSPDQVNDVNYGYYPKNQKLKWDSTSTYSV